MAAILDRIKRAEAARAGANAAHQANTIAAMTAAELIADIARLDALRGISPQQVAQNAAFWDALQRGDIDAQRALDKHRIVFGKANLATMTVAEMRAELADFDAMRRAIPVAADLSNFA